MIPLENWLLFVSAALLLVLTPGPNMIYLISRSICQGRLAGVWSLVGILVGFTFHILTATLGLSAIFLAAPLAYGLLKWAGALYLLWLAWQTIKPGAQSPFEPRQLSSQSPRKLIFMGFLTSLLNPKLAFFYISFFPQFIAPEHGSVFAQSIQLGLTQIFVSGVVNLIITLSASILASWFARNTFWLAIQRYVMGLVLGALGLRLALIR